jgi:transposase-like protein
MRYTQNQKQAALERIRANGGNVAAAARYVNIPYHTVRRWHHAAQAEAPPAPSPSGADVLAQLERQLGDLALTLANTLLDEQAPGTLPQRTSALGALVDRLLKFEKLRDERESSTGHTKYIVRRVIFQDADGTEDERPPWQREGTEPHGDTNGHN